MNDDVLLPVRNTFSSCCRTGRNLQEREAGSSFNASVPRGTKHKGRRRRDASDASKGTMQKEEQAEGVSEDSSAVKVVAALVLSGDFENFVALRKQAKAIGLRIIFAKTAPLWAKLWICEGENPPPEAAGTGARR